MDLVATSPRHPEVGETVLGDDLRRFPGGKGANQAVAAARAGAATAMIGAVGDDDFGSELTAFLERERVDVSHVATKADQPTGTALIVVARSDNTIVVIPGANSLLSPADVVAAGDFERGDVVVAQLETPQETTARAFELARSRGATTILNAAPAAQLSAGLLDLVDHLVVNESELELLSPELEAGESPTVICTLGARGVVTTAQGHTTATPGISVAAVDTTGAGDCFVGYLAAGLATRLDLDNSVERANRAAALSVQREGAAPSMPAATEVDQSR
jgi:ribokinase